MLTRVYTDVNGDERRLMFVQKLDRMSTVTTDSSPAQVIQWRDTEGKLYNLPENTWEVLNIVYKDENGKQEV